jgi:hypothetical protein
MERFSRSTVSATDLLLTLVMTEDCALSTIRIPSFAVLVPPAGPATTRISAGRNRR